MRKPRASSRPCAKKIGPFPGPPNGGFRRLTPLLAVVISLLPLASLGDIFGYRRIYMIGLVVFTGAALVSALSHSLPMLTLGRALQGLGAFWACRRKEGCSDSSREVPRAANHQ